MKRMLAIDKAEVTLSVMINACVWPWDKDSVCAPVNPPMVKMKETQLVGSIRSDYHHDLTDSQRRWSQWKFFEWSESEN